MRGSGHGHGPLEKLYVVVHVLPDEFHLGEHGDTLPRNLQFRSRYDLSNNAAGLGKRHQADIAWIRKGIAQQNLKKPEFHLADFLSVHGRITAGLEEPEESALGLDQNLLFAKPGQCLRANGVAEFNKLIDKVVGVAVELGRRQPGKNRIEGRIASRGLVNNPDAIQVTVEAPPQGKFHDGGAQKSSALILQRNVDEPAIFVLQREQKELLRNCQHVLPH